MGLTTALFTGLTGLNANAQSITIAGNNISNVNTTAFKASRPDFETQITQNLRTGSGPTDSLGGTNPIQIGLGTRLAGITRDFSDGSLQLTGRNTDLAVEGTGFFIVDDGESVKYTRDGAFSRDRENNLVTNDGFIVQGYAVDDDFNVIDGVLTDINLPIGGITLAEATESVNLQGNLNAAGDIAKKGSIHLSGALYSDNVATTPATGADLLTNLFDAEGNQLFTDGDILTIAGITKGGATMPKTTFEVGAANTTESSAFGETLDSFISLLQDVVGIDTDVNGGVSINADGQINIEGNIGTDNGLDITPANIVLNQGDENLLPFTFEEVQEADGESVRTSFFAFDSLGSQMVLDVTMVLEEKTNAGTSWRYYAQSNDDSDIDRTLGNGMLNFDTDGQLINVSNDTFTIDRENTGAFSPQSIRLSFDQSEDGGTRSTGVSALAQDSQVSAVSQDGFAVGTLADFSIGTDGTIVGLFTNSQQRTLGQVVIATFSNPDGLIEQASNVFAPSAASGNPAVLAAGTGGSGTIVNQALELSNVDLSNEFISLINASTGFSANSRVLSTSDRLLQDLLASLR